MISNRRHWIFVHIQKTGGNAMRTALGVELNDPHKHRFATELRDIYGEKAWSACCKFSIVRNPWDRLVSWWSTIDSYREHFNAGAIDHGFYCHILGRAQTFEEFLFRCDQDFSDSDGIKNIYRNQIDYLSDDTGRIMVDFVGRFERLPEDAARIAARLGVRDFALPHVNRSRHGPYTEYYTEETIELVARRYRRDIERFGYRYGG